MLDYLSVGLAWLVPGAGHFALGQWARGTLFAVVIHLLFFGGVFIGGIRAINPEEQPIWVYTQYMAGWPMLAATVVQRQQPVISKDLVKIHDVGAVYCGIAGMLNLLVAFDVLLQIGNGRRDEGGAK